MDPIRPIGPPERDLEPVVRVTRSSPDGERERRDGRRGRHGRADVVEAARVRRGHEPEVQAVARWEPRIEPLTVTATAEGDGACVSIDIAYRIRATNDHRNLVFPFYVIPQEEAAP